MAVPNIASVYQKAYIEHYCNDNIDIAVNGYLTVLKMDENSREASEAAKNLEKIIEKTPIDIKKIDFELRELYQSFLVENQYTDVVDVTQEKEKAALFLMTTSGNFEGYVVERYIDVVCEDVVFKNSFKNSVSASFENIRDSFKFKETEVSGPTKLIANAKEYVLGKFKSRVKSLGANAALGVDFETSFGSDVARVSISGTAVYIRKIEG